jgi:predicted O-methyltransferase YrrM
MSQRTIEQMSPALMEYILSVSLRDNPILTQLRQASVEHTQLGDMLTQPEQLQFIQLLIELTGARTILELGTFTGYSALAMAQALPSDGRIITCDINAQWTQVGQPFWQQANVADKIESHLMPASELLAQLQDSGANGSFDLAFIDADKRHYLTYYEQCLALLKPGGLVIIDNTLWDGKVIDDDDTRPSTQVIRELNQLIFHDERVHMSLVPLGDGLTLCRKC